jgi:hypothetical protein
MTSEHEMTDILTTKRQLEAEVKRLRKENEDLRRWKALDKPLTAAMYIANTEIQHLRAEKIEAVEEWAKVQAERELELHAEIKALRDLIANSPEGRFDTSGERERLRAEIRRGAREGLEREEKLIAEIDRLHALLEAKTTPGYEFLSGTIAAEITKLRALIQALLDNDPDDSAADGVTVLEVWRKEARRALGEKK